MNNTKVIPEDFVLDKTISMKNNKGFIVMMSIFTILIFCISQILFIRFKSLDMASVRDEIISYGFDENSAKWFSRTVFIASLLTLLLFVVFHELIHGIIYKISTKGKLKFGLTIWAAYCGVPDFYCNKKTAILSLISPLIIISTIVLPLTLCNLPLHVNYFFSYIFSFHLGGCVGDIYGFFLILIRYKGKEILINDNGLEQRFYVRKVS